MQFKWSNIHPHQCLNLLPRTYSRHTRRSNVFGAVVAGHCLAAAFICRIRRTRTTQILFRCLHDTFGVLNLLVHAVPVLAHLCVCFFFSGCTASFSGFRRHLGEGVIKLTHIKIPWNEYQTVVCETGLVNSATYASMPLLAMYCRLRMVQPYDVPECPTCMLFIIALNPGLFVNM